MWPSMRKTRNVFESRRVNKSRSELDGAAYSLPVKIKAELPLGIAGLPVGLPGLAGISLPVRSVLEREGKPSHAS